MGIHLIISSKAIAEVFRARALARVVDEVYVAARLAPGMGITRFINRLSELKNADVKTACVLTHNLTSRLGTHIVELDKYCDVYAYAYTIAFPPPSTRSTKGLVIFAAHTPCSLLEYFRGMFSFVVLPTCVVDGRIAVTGRTIGEAMLPRNAVREVWVLAFAASNAYNIVSKLVRMGVA